MRAFPEPGRQVAHVFLDAASAYDGEAASTELNEAAVNLAVQRLSEIEGTYLVTVDDAGDDVNVALDLSHVVGGATITVLHLVRELAAARGVDEVVIISEVREFVDTDV